MTTSKWLSLNRGLLNELKRVSTVMVYGEKTNEFFKIRKSELRNTCKERIVYFYITDKIFVNKRNVIVIT